MSRSRKVNIAWSGSFLLTTGSILAMIGLGVWYNLSSQTSVGPAIVILGWLALQGLFWWLARTGRAMLGFGILVFWLFGVVFINAGVLLVFAGEAPERSATEHALFVSGMVAIGLTVVGYIWMAADFRRLAKDA